MGQDLKINGGLLTAVLAISWASILVRWCEATPALVIAFYRMFWSAGLLLLLHKMRHPGKPLFSQIGRGNLLLVFLAGIFLALHFVSWIASVQFTLISHALVLSSTHPVWALLLSPFILKEKGGWKAVTAAVLVMSGILLLVGQDWQAGEAQLQGDLLALLAALFITFYLLIARQQRGGADLLPYLIIVYGTASLLLLPVILISGFSLFDYPAQSMFSMLLLAVVPTGIGHSLLNWAARRLEVYKVNFAALGEPLFASLLGFFIFGEVPYGYFYPAAALILLGIGLALLDAGGTPKPKARGE
ncbi:MAG: DMT family transporter [Calditrichia bacterium]